MFLEHGLNEIDILFDVVNYRLIFLACLEDILKLFVDRYHLVCHKFFHLGLCCRVLVKPSYWLTVGI